MCRTACVSRRRRRTENWIYKAPSLPLEGKVAFAKQMTERAARLRVCIRANLMRILPICKTPSVLPQSGKSSSLTREPALSVAARHLSQRERQVWSVRKSKTKALVPEKFPVLVLFLCLSASYSPSSSGSEDCSSSFLSSTNSFFAASSKETVASAACGASVPFSSSCFAVFAMPDSMWNTCAPVS